MGSPVSVIVAEIVMQAIEERVIATDLVMLHWRHFHYRAPRSDEINTFHEHLNEQNPDIQFTKEIEENGKLPFFRLPGNPWKQQNTDNSLQKADTYWQNTWPIILQP